MPLRNLVWLLTVPAVILVDPHSGQFRPVVACRMHGMPIRPPDSW